VKPHKTIATVAAAEGSATAKRDPEQKIARPRQIYIGRDVRDFVPIEKRGLEAARERSGS